MAITAWKITDFHSSGFAHGCPNGLGAALIGKLLLSGPKKRMGPCGRDENGMISWESIFGIPIASWFLVTFPFGVSNHGIDILIQIHGSHVSS